MIGSLTCGSQLWKSLDRNTLLFSFANRFDESIDDEVTQNVSLNHDKFLNSQSLGPACICNGVVRSGSQLGWLLSLFIDLRRERHFAVLCRGKQCVRDTVLYDTT